MNSIEIYSLFPEAVSTVFETSILRRAQLKGALDLKSIDLRSFAQDKHKTVDDTPFSGKQGMLLKPDVLSAASQQAVGALDRSQIKILYPSPRGLPLKQEHFWDFASWLLEEPHRKVALFCGRYEGVDERWLDQWVDLEFSMGDFIVTGGELPALSFVDALVRLIPGVLGNEISAREESFSEGLLEQPQYTRPRNWQGQEVPEVLMSGHHKKIQEWKLRESLQLTAAFRPDLIVAHDGSGLPEWAQDLLLRLKKRCQSKGNESNP